MLFSPKSFGPNQYSYNLTALRQLRIIFLFSVWIIKIKYTKTGNFVIHIPKKTKSWLQRVELKKWTAGASKPLSPYYATQKE